MVRMKTAKIRQCFPTFAQKIYFMVMQWILKLFCQLKYTLKCSQLISSSDNKKCQARFRPLCNKILLHIMHVQLSCLPTDMPFEFLKSVICKYPGFCKIAVVCLLRCLLKFSLESFFIPVAVIIYLKQNFFHFWSKSCKLR